MKKVTLTHIQKAVQAALKKQKVKGCSWDQSQFMNECGTQGCVWGLACLYAGADPKNTKENLMINDGPVNFYDSKSVKIASLANLMSDDDPLALKVMDVVLKAEKDTNNSIRASLHKACNEELRKRAPDYDLVDKLEVELNNW
jgi:hypothetical protein